MAVIIMNVVAGDVEFIYKEQLFIAIDHLWGPRKLLQHHG